MHMKRVGGSKKPKVNTKFFSNNRDNIHLKRQLGTFTCRFYGEKRHIQGEVARRKE